MCQLIDSIVDVFLRNQERDAASSEALERKEQYQRLDMLRDAMTRYFDEDRGSRSRKTYSVVIPNTMPLEPSAYGMNRIELACCESTIDKFYRLHTRAIVNQQTCSIRMQTTVLQDGLPLIVKSRKLRLLLMRYLHKLNSTMKDGFFRVSATNGWITLSVESLFSTTGFWDLVYKTKDCIKFIESEILLSRQLMKFSIYKILYLANELTEENLNYLTAKGVAYRRVKDDWAAIMTIRNALAFSHEKHEFMRHADLDNIGLATKISDEELHAQRQQHARMLNQSAEGFQKELVAYLKFYEQISSDGEYTMGHSIYGDFPQNKITDFVNYLRIPPPKMANQLEKPQIYNQIYIVNEESVKWELIGQGGFSEIWRGDVQIIYIDDKTAGKSDDQLKTMKERMIRKLVVKKVTKNGSDSRKIEHEKQILTQLRNKNCAHIAKFYYSNQPRLEKTLLMDYCPGRSLETFLRNNELTITTFNLIFLVYQASQALRFLNVNNIRHLDVKPPNLLMARNLLLRIIDFGESYHPQVCDSTFQPGFTMPYSPPEIFKKTKVYTPLIDVFGLGNVQHQVIFERSPFDLNLNRRALEKLRQHYCGKNNIMMALILPQRTGNVGNPIAMQLIQQLTLKAMELDQKKRPLVDWIVVILREAFNLVERTY